MHTDLTFFTNEPGSTLLDRFVKTLKDVRYFDILVGYFRSSGFFRLYKTFENIEIIRILVGLNLDKKTFQIIETANNRDFESHTKVKEIFGNELVSEIDNSDEIKKAGRDILKYLNNTSISLSTSLTPITDDMTDSRKCRSLRKLTTN